MPYFGSGRRIPDRPGSRSSLPRSCCDTPWSCCDARSPGAVD